MTMNYVEEAECLLDAGGSGNMNWAFLAATK